MWSAFHRKWNRTLRKTPRIKHFHGKEFSVLGGEFYQFKDPIKWPKPEGSKAATAKRDELVRLVEESQLIGCGVGIRIPDYNEVRQSHPRAKTFRGTDAFEYALQEIVHQTTHAVRTYDSVPRSFSFRTILKRHRGIPRFTTSGNSLTALRLNRC